MTWREQAACLDSDPEVFFPAKGSNTSTHPARAICATCPVTHHCLTYAVTTNQEDGIWAGTTPRQRVEIRKQQGIRRPPRGRTPRPRRGYDGPHGHIAKDTL